MMLMVAGLTAFEGRHFCVTALGRSAHAFCQYFQALQQEPMNPVQRVVFSLVLVKTNPVHSRQSL
jgi:hypothetical protein